MSSLIDALRNGEKLFRNVRQLAELIDGQPPRRQPARKPAPRGRKRSR